MNTGSNVKGKNKEYQSKRDSADNYDGNNDLNEEEFVIIPPNGGWGWVVVICAFYCNVVTDGIQLTFGIFLQDIAEEFNVEKSKVSLVGSLMFGLHLLMGPVCSGLSNVHGIRPITAVGSLICALGLSLCYFSPNYEFLYFSYGVLGGIGLGLVYMNTLVITSLYFTSLRVLAVAIVVCGTGFGTVTFALLGNELLKIMDWQTSFLVEAAIAGSMFLAALTFRPLKPKRIIFTTDEGLLTAKHSLTSRISRYSKVSKMSRFSYISRDETIASAFSAKSRRATIYIRRNTKQSRSLISVHTMVAEKLAHQTILKQLSVHPLPCRCCRCKRCARDEVVFFHPEDKYEKFEEYIDVPRTMNNSWVSGIDELTPEVSEISKRAVKTIEKKHYCDCRPLKETIRIMLDFKLLRSCAFVLYCLSGALAMSSLLVVLLYERDRAIDHGFSKDTATYLVATLGAANMFWRLFLGLISTVVKVNICIASITLSLIGATSIIASGFWENLYFQYVSNVIFALGMAGFAVFRPVLLIDLIGSDLILNATGIALLAMGITCIITPPLSGLLMEATKNYETIVYAAGSLLAISGLLLIKIDKIRKNELTHRRNLL